MFPQPLHPLPFLGRQRTLVAHWQAMRWTASHFAELHEPPLDLCRPFSRGVGEGIRCFFLCELSDVQTEFPYP